MYKAFSCKLWWNFRCGLSLWAQFLNAKYCKGFHPCQISVPTLGSATWKRILDIRGLAELFIGWSLHEGRCSFWYDNWTGHGALFLMMGVRENVSFLTVMEDREWVTWKLAEVLPCDLVQQVSFFMLRLLSNRLPMDDVLAAHGFQLPSKCSCCLVLSTESLRHLFLEGELATVVRQFFVLVGGLAMNVGDVRVWLIGWWLKPVHSGVPGVRAAAYGGLSCHISRVKECFFAQIWGDTSGGRLAYVLGVGRVQAGCVPRASDSVARSMAWRSRSILMGAQKVEAKALLLGLQICAQRGFGGNLVVETDSLMLQRILLKHCQSPWSISVEVGKIELLAGGSCQFIHCYREANKVVAVLANASSVHHQHVVYVYEGIADLPKLARDAYRWDRLGFPSFRKFRVTGATPKM
ncbi:uncharacterized protein [Coffea arabica]|uniref:RNase H type-1 domain-containing protein n=1 Tax=Coffea arabica TaxID=13443 RepID=A0ABM4VUM8_COFAR